MINLAASGALMGKERDEAYELLEEMASNSYQWQSKRVTPKTAAGVHEIDTFVGSPSTACPTDEGTWSIQCKCNSYS